MVRSDHLTVLKIVQLYSKLVNPFVSKTSCLKQILVFPQRYARFVFIVALVLTVEENSIINGNKDISYSKLRDFCNIWSQGSLKLFG